MKKMTGKTLLPLSALSLLLAAGPALAHPDGDRVEQGLDRRH